jgi:HEAT repeat protein
MDARIRLALALFLVAAPAAAAGRCPGTEPADDPDVRLLEKAGLSADDDALTAYLLDFAANPADVGPLIRQLGDEDFRRREEASRRLGRLGWVVLPALRRALDDPDLEIALRARVCIQKIEGAAAAARAPAAAVRLTLRRRPPGAAAALLAYLPFSADENLTEDIVYGLDALAAGDAPSRVALATALADAVPTRRAAAACILARVGGRGGRAAAKLLDDPDPVVRLRAAQGLLAAKDKAALPRLVALLDEESVEVAWQAEELLHYAAGDDSLDIVVGAGAAEQRRKCRAAWETWWKEHGAALDLAALDREPRCPALYLVCCPADRDHRGASRVFLCGCDGQPRWELADVTGPEDAQWLPGGRVLLTESGWWGWVKRVSERDLTGAVLWKKDFDDLPASACRLPNGHTFIVTHRAMVEIDADGRKVFQHPHDNFRVKGAQRTEDGSIIFVDYHGMIWSMDAATGEATKRCDLSGRDEEWINGVEALRNGQYLVSGFRSGEVREVDESGRVVWRCQVKSGEQALRLRNGNTLVADGAAWSLVEFEPGGRRVWEAALPQSPERVRPLLGLVSLGFGRAKGVEVDPAAALVRRLKSKDVVLRRHLVEELAKLKGKAASAVPALVAAAGDADPRVREEVFWALQEIGPPAKEAIPMLIGALHDPDAWVRDRAAGVLVSFGPAAETAIPALVTDLDESEETLRAGETAARALRAIGPAAAPALRKALGHEKPRVRAGAARVLGWFLREDRSFLPDMNTAMKDSDAAVRRTAARSLHDAARDERPAELVAALAAALRDPDAEVRGEAVAALEEIGPSAKSAVPALIAALDDADEQLPTHLGAVCALAAVGAAAEPALKKALADKDPRLRAGAVNVLGRLFAKDPSSAADLVGALKDADPFVRRTAVGAMRGAVGEADEALPALLETLQDTDVTVRREAAALLRVLGREYRITGYDKWPTAAELYKALKDEDEEVRGRAEKALGALAMSGKYVVQDLAKRVKRDGSASDRAAAAEALGRIGPDARDAIPTLTAAADDTDETVRKAASKALEKVRR